MADVNASPPRRDGRVLTCRRCGAADPALKMFEECSHCGEVYTPGPGEEPWPLEHVADAARKGQLDPRIELPVMTALGIVLAFFAYETWTGAWTPLISWHRPLYIVYSGLCFTWVAVRLIALAIGRPKKKAR